MKTIIEEIIKFKNKNKSIITIKDKLNKKHKRYESFINDVCNMIYYSKIEDINEWLYNYMLNWLYSHTLEKAFEMKIEEKAQTTIEQEASKNKQGGLNTDE